MKKLALFSFLSLVSFSLFSQKIIPMTDAMRQQFLAAHNKYRKEVGVPPLKWSADLENFAKKWALVLARIEDIKHSDNANYGENIYMSSDFPDAQTAVGSWASEKNYYHGEPIQLDNYWIFGHYTQIIWKDTKEVGCAIAQSAKGMYYVVCEYYPAGNVIGKKPVPDNE